MKTTQEQEAKTKTETYRLTDEGLNRLVGILRIQERNFMPKPEDWLDGPTFAPTLLERGLIIQNETPQMAGILLTEMGLNLFVTLEKMREDCPPSPWTVENCPDILVWLSENGLVYSTSNMMVPDCSEEDYQREKARYSNAFSEAAAD
jgi:predicted transcriptional regulator